MIAFPLQAALDAGADRVVVVTGHQEVAVQDAVREAAGPRADAIGFAHQAQQNGTGHAVLCALPQLPHDEAVVWILNGDTPLIRAQTLHDLAEDVAGREAGLVMTSVRPEDRTGYGRLVRDGAGHPKLIREERDCAAEELSIEECNAGIYAVRARHLHEELPTLGSNNDQGEIYLTDLVELRARGGVVGVRELDAREAAGVNTRAQLEALEAEA